MQVPQIVVFEPDGRLLSQVRSLAEAERWLLREAKTPAAVLKSLTRPGPAAVLIRIGRDLERELGLLEQVSWLYPLASAVVVGDSDHAVLAGLAWDLGAKVVLIPAPQRDLLQETIRRLLQPEETPHAGAAAPR